MSKLTFNNRQNIFYNTLKSAVDEYFVRQDISKTGNWKLYLKTIVLFPLAIALYVSLLTLHVNIWWGIGLSIVLGFTLAFIGFNVMHGARHGSEASKKRISDTFSVIMNGLRGNAFIWKLKHNIIHHTYTNIDGIDDDIVKTPVLRECSTQKWMPVHRYQQYYIFILYGFTSLIWVFLTDYLKYFTQRVLVTPFKKMDFREHFIFWISKVLYLVFYVAIPVAAVGWGAWAIGFLVMHLALGFTLALVFQLAHVVEQAEFEVAGLEPKRIENEWAIFQIKTTADFAGKNKILSWLIGGLNFQVEHHLFPRVSHVHYPAISKIVKETCHKFNLPYNYYPTMTSALASHYRLMKQLGTKPFPDQSVDSALTNS